MPVKEYFHPGRLEEVSDLLISFSGSAKILAGGTDLLIQMMPKTSPEVTVISLRAIDELKDIKQYNQGKIFIGAMATHTDVTESPLVNKYFPALAKASSLVGSPSIRNLGTIGGNICNASPAADTAPPLIAYDAKAIIWNSLGEKEVNVEDFFTGPQMNILETCEILKGFILKPRNRIIAAYEKLGTRKAMEVAIANVCISLLLEENMNCSQIRIALGSVAPTPIRAKKAENILENSLITSELIKKAAKIAIKEIKPISDIRGSADYRKEMIGFIVEKMISYLTGLEEA